MTAVSPAALAATRVVADPRWSPDGTRLGWVEQVEETTGTLGHPAAGFALVVGRADGLAPPVGAAAVARVRADGGGRWCWTSERELLAVDPDGRLRTVDGAHLLFGESSVAVVAAGPDGLVAFGWERSDAFELMELGTAGAVVAQLCSHADFAWDPCYSPDGRLAWHEWDLPAMPWDGSRIVVREPNGATSTVAGSDGIMVGQPRFSPDGRHLAYISDATGWANVWIADPDGANAHPLLDEPHEHAEPSWAPGQRSFAWSPDGREVALVRNEGGFARLVAVGVTGRVTPRELARGWHHGLDWGRAGIVAVRSGARTPPQITVLDPASGERRVVARGAPEGIEAGAVEPETVWWRSERVAGGEMVHGLLYRPRVPVRGGGLPPLLVDVHGGPTGQATVTWEARTALFTARGWAVLRPDHRGSTGHGREYRRALEGRWGSLDVADVQAGIREAVARGWCAPRRVAIVGGSAGGMAALLVAARDPELVGACVAWYPVTDLTELAGATHRFESRYTDRLVGVLPGDAAVLLERSPISHAAGIRVPLLVLQGDKDPVVSPGQASAFVAAVRAGGGTVDHVTYAGEGHGWSMPETVVDALTRTLEFCEQQVLG